MKRFKFIVIGLLLTMAIGGATILALNYACLTATQMRIFRSTATVPNYEIGLLLCCPKYHLNGDPNLHFNQRVEAAVELYRAGKVRHLLVSGDNYHWRCNEPTDMRAALVAAGVPTNVITCDYAGFRTLDSILRAQKIFGINRCMIISEEFHCPRALWIAQRHGLEAVAFAAPDVAEMCWPLEAKFREVFARAWCGLDLYIWNRGPKLLGAPQPLTLSTNLP